MSALVDSTAFKPPVRLDSEEVGVFNRRFGVALQDGSRVEAVLYRGDTLCISCQVGCAVRCPFCASGANGLGRHLALEEMVGQVREVRALGHRIERVTVSGVGEPLHNHGVVRDLVRWCRGEKIRPSLTTTGGPLPRLREWLHQPHNGLTVSVHAGTEKMRRRMVPKGPPLDALFGTLYDELPRMSVRRRRKLALAYLLVAGQTDGPDEVDAFIERVRPCGSVDIHLYQYNPVSTSADRPAERDRYEGVYRRMASAGLRVRMSSQARIEANGGCGTLVALRPPRPPQGPAP